MTYTDEQYDILSRGKGRLLPPKTVKVEGRSRRVLVTVIVSKTIKVMYPDPIQND